MTFHVICLIIACSQAFYLGMRTERASIHRQRSIKPSDGRLELKERGRRPW